MMVPAGTPDLRFDADAPSVFIDDMPVEDLPLLVEEEGKQADAINPLVFEHYANIAEFLPEDKLRKLGEELLETFEADLLTREPWERTAEDGLDLLGIELKQKRRNEPFPGASSVTDPLITEAIVRYQSASMQNLFPPAGPVKTKIWGNATAEDEAAAQRKQEHMNHVLLSEIPDYRSETERMLWEIPYCGAAFRKVFLDPVTGKIRAPFFDAKDVIIPYGYPNLWVAPRYSLLNRYDKAQIKALQDAKFYRSVNIQTVTEQRSSLEQRKDEVSKQEPSHVLDGRNQVIEMYIASMTFEGVDDVSSPYVVTFERASRTILAIYRNWDEADADRQAIHWTTQHTYIPGPGSYGLGLIHLIGNLAKASTGALQVLLDAAARETLGGGFVDKQVRTEKSDLTVQPYKYQQIETGTKSIAESIYTFPFSGPSQVTAQLRNEVRAAAKDMAAIADPMNGSINGEIPAATLLMMLEHRGQVKTAMQARLHASFANEFLTIERAIKMRLQRGQQTEYPYDVEGGARSVKISDYSPKYRCVPVSDPNLATQTENTLKLQAVMAASAQAPPGIYDPAALHRQFVRAVLGNELAQKLVPDRSFIPPMDPVSEVQAILDGTPVKAYPLQDHESHLDYLMAWMQSPKTQKEIGQNPNGQAIQAAAIALMMSRVGFIERRKIEEQLGHPLPPYGEPLAPEIEMHLSRAMAEARKRLLQEEQKQAAMEQQMAQMQDPVLQQENKRIAIEEFKVKSKASAEQGRIELDRMKAISAADANNKRIMLEMQKLQDAMRTTNPDIALLQAKTAQILDQMGRDNTGANEPVQ